MVQRICFRLQVRSDRIEEYSARHRTVWTEMRDALREAGWRNYSLFLDGDGALTGYLECDDFEVAQAAMAATDVNARWQAEVAGFFTGLDEAGPDERIIAIPEIFHLD